MSQCRATLQPIQGAVRTLGQRLRLRHEFVLALLPTMTILGIFGLVEACSHQRLLFASLASNELLIYLDPEHATNTIRTLVTSHMLAATTGLITYILLGSGYAATGSALLITIVLMILQDAMHPPAVATALSFAFRAENTSNFLRFGLAVGITALLALLEQATLWLLLFQTCTPGIVNACQPGL